MATISFDDLAPYSTGAPLYLELGWWPLPLQGKGRGKGASVPTGYTGYGGKPVVREDVEQWAVEKADWNVALRFGRDVCGIDVDCYDGKQGARTLAELEEKYGKLPPAWTSTSREDGSKVRVYRKPASIKLPGKAGPGIEIIQFHHRYMVAWPSRHPETGNQYHWFNPEGKRAAPPRLEDLTDFPAAWYEMKSLAIPVSESGDKERDTGYTDPDITMLPILGIPDEENQDEVLRDVCWKLKLGGRSEDEIRTVWQAIVEKTPLTRPEEPWTDEDFQRHLRGAEEKLEGQDFSLGEVSSWNPESPSSSRLVLAWPSNPSTVARQFSEIRYLLPREDDSLPTILRWRGDFLVWEDGCWVVKDTEDIRAELYQFLESAYIRVPKIPEYEPWNPNTTRVNNVLDALGALYALSSEAEEGCWIEFDRSRKVTAGHGKGHGKNDQVWRVFAAHDAEVTVGNSKSSSFDSEKRQESIEVVSSIEYRAKSKITVTAVTGPALLDITERKLSQATPQFFSLHKITALYGSGNGIPQWCRYLESVWPDDKASVDLLQEWFGYVISGETRAQKMLAMIGPKRSGKGTAARVLEMLVGKRYCTGATLSSLTENFGLETWVGKRLAVIGDARLRAGGKDMSLAVSRLLMITGGDEVHIDRKNKKAWNGQSPTRVMILSNETPAFVDASGAIASRTLMLQLSVSWYGQEDFLLIEGLTEELGGILDWALDGYDRLRDNGWRFTEPESAQELADEMGRLASPVSCFIAECCDMSPVNWAYSDEIFAYWKAWCEAQGIRPGAQNWFIRDLRAACDGQLGTRTGKHPVTGKRARITTGIALSPDANVPAENLWLPSQQR